MSKSKGNVIDPWTVLDTRGADALRWNFFSAGSPWTPRRVSVEAIDESARFLVTLWNTYSFFVTYANLDGWTPGTDARRAASTHVLDRWVRSRLHGTVAAVTEALDGFDALRGAQALERFVDDLSNWYVRRSRARASGTADGDATTRARDAARVPLDARAAARAVHAVRRRRAPPQPQPAATSRCTSPTGPRSTPTRATTRSRPRWSGRARSCRSACRRATRRSSRCASRCGARSCCCPTAARSPTRSRPRSPTRST